MHVSVLFVCSGNICRSPMAEAIFRHKVQTAGLQSRVLVDSAGTGSWHAGDPAHPGTRAVLHTHGISSDGLKARRVSRHDFQTFDYLVAMDGEHEHDLTRWARDYGLRGRIVRMLDYASPSVAQGRRDVPDPYYTGQFELVFTLLDSATNGLLAEIQEALRQIA